MSPPLYVALGGAAGALARYYASLWIGARWGEAFPLATLAINLAGCFLIGVLSTLTLLRVPWFAPELRLLLVVGFCGGFTTFSTYGWEGRALLAAGQPSAALSYLLGSVVLGLGLVYLGAALAAWAVGPTAG